MVVDRTYCIKTKYRRYNRSDNKKSRMKIFFHLHSLWEIGPHGHTELQQSYNVNFLFQ